MLLAGAVTALASANPSPLVGLGFGLSATLLAVSLLLAARVFIALERARRLAQPRTAHTGLDSAPVTTAFLGRVGLLPSSRAERTVKASRGSRSG